MLNTRPGAKVPDSAIAAGLRWAGVAISEPDYTIWGAAPPAGLYTAVIGLRAAFRRSISDW